MDKAGSAPGRDYSVLCEGRRFRPLYPHRREVFRREPERHSYCTPFGRGSYSKIVGADAVLLIAAALELEKCNELAEKAHSLGLEVLLEIHNSDELGYINKEVDMVGINNRNLGTFFTDVENSFRLAGQLPQNAVLVSESGISDPETVKRLRAAGFRGFLIGETFMKTGQPGETLQNFLQAI